MEKRTVKVADIIPYGNNPRNNDGAVEVVKASIDEVGYITPIVVDEDMVVLAGHTRLKALTESGVEEVEVIVSDGMTEDQKRKYRILDNKTCELAQWDFDALRAESEGLDFTFDFGIGDLLQKGENLEKADAAKKGKQERTKVCTCPRCGKQWEE